MTEWLDGRGVESTEYAAGFPQETYWTLADRSPGTAVLVSNVWRVVTIEGDLDDSVLHDSLRHMMARHEALRTSLHQKGGVLVQRVFPEITVPLVLVDHEGDAPESEPVQRLVRDFVHGSFDLSFPPLFRLLRVRLCRNVSVLAVCVHHSVCDAHSLQIFFRDLWTAYRALMSGVAVELPGKGQYHHVSEYQSGWSTDRRLLDQLSYWERRMEDLEPRFEFPLKAARTSVTARRRVHTQIRMDGSDYRRVLECARSTRTAPSAVLVAALSLKLEEYTTSEYIALGMIYANRANFVPDCLGIVGMVANNITLKLRTGSPVEDARARIRSVWRENMMACMNGTVPFEVVAERTGYGRGVIASRRPAWEVWLNVNESLAEERGDGVVTCLPAGFHVEDIDVKPWSRDQLMNDWDGVISQIHLTIRRNGVTIDVRGNGEIVELSLLRSLGEGMVENARRLVNSVIP